MLSKTVDIDAAKIELRPDGIMHVHVKVPMNFELKHSMQIVEARTQLAQDRSYPILYTSGQLVIPSAEVREYVASEPRSKLVTADAFIVNSLPQRIIANFYLKWNKPVRPTKMFDKEEEAIAWLKNYV